MFEYYYGMIIVKMEFMFIFLCWNI